VTCCGVARDGGQMAPAMTGPQTAAAEITKITAMIAHDHQSLSPDCVGMCGLRLARRSHESTATNRRRGVWAGRVEGDGTSGQLRRHSLQCGALQHVSNARVLVRDRQDRIGEP
jgi:hypothetical protein